MKIINNADEAIEGVFNYAISTLVRSSFAEGEQIVVDTETARKILIEFKSNLLDYAKETEGPEA